MLQSFMFYRNIIVIVWSVHFLSSFYFIGDKIAADCFKDEITPSLKSNDRLKFSQDVLLNHVIDKVKPRYKTSYKLLKAEDGYDTLLDIS